MLKDLMNRECFVGNIERVFISKGSSLKLICFRYILLFRCNCIPLILVYQPDEIMFDEYQLN